MGKHVSNIQEDSKDILQLAETALEVLSLTVLYYMFWKKGYNMYAFAYKGKYVLMGIYGILTYVLFQNSESVMFGQRNSGDLLIGQIIALLIVNFVTFLQLSLIANSLVSPIPIFCLTGAEILLAACFVLMYAALYHKLYAPNDLLLVFGKERGVGLKVKMDARKDIYNVTQMICVDEGYDRIVSEISKHDAVILADVPAQLRNDILKHCYHNGKSAYVAPKLTDIMIRGAKSITLFDAPLLLVKGTGITIFQRIMKRLVDIILSSVALLIFLIPMIIVAIAIKIEDGGPVFFTQKRMTRYGREFEIYKFRSMIVDAEKYAGAVLATENDPRITKVGKVIRATRLDEIPQILNILKGDMSVVGPRPERKVIAEKFIEEIPEFYYRLKVKGGLTGYAQIYGKYNTSAYDKLRMDLMYIENYSILLDIKLILMTIRILFSKESTEGIDKAEENKKIADALIHEMEQRSEH